MQTATTVWGRWQAARLRLFQRRSEMSVGAALGLCLGAACLTGLLAQVRIPLPYTPVPFTGQVFGVLLAGTLLGRRYGGFSQLLYVGLGAAGVPWFAGTHAGLPAVTGGYLLGFIPAAVIAGSLTDRFRRLRTVQGQTLVMLAAIATIYLCGAIQFAAVMRTGFRATLMGAVIPFIGLDAAKALAAAAVAGLLLPKTAHDDGRSGACDAGRP